MVIDRPQDLPAILTAGAGACGSGTAETADTDESVNEQLNISEANRRLPLTSSIDPSSMQVTI